MNVLLNGESCQLPDTATVEKLLRTLKLWDSEEGLPRGIAVAVNDEVIARPEWTAHVLSPDDNVLLITATQGG